MDDYSNAVEFVLHHNRTQFDQIQSLLKSLVCKELFRIPKSSLPKLVEVFYYEIGERNNTTDATIRRLMPDNYEDVDIIQILYLIHQCLPLITYIETYLNNDEKTNDKNRKRENLTLYMLLRLIERCFQMREGINPMQAYALPHPFAHSDDDDGYSRFIRSIEPYKDVDLDDILLETNKNHFLIHLILLTAIYALEEDGPDERIGKLNMEVEGFNSHTNPKYLQLRRYRYPLMDDIRARLQPPSTPITKADRLMTRFLISRLQRYPDEWMNKLVQCCQRLLMMREKLIVTYKNLEKGGDVWPIIEEDLKSARLLSSSADGMQILPLKDTTVVFLSAEKVYAQLSNPIIAHHMILERYVTKILTELLPRQESFESHRQGGGVQIGLYRDKIFAVLMKGYLPRSWYDPAISSLLSKDEDALKSFTMTCLVILALKLRVNYYSDRLSLGFYISDDHMLCYVPNTKDPHLNFQNSYICNGRLNYYGMLLGDNRQSPLHTKRVERFSPWLVDGSYGPIRAAWMASSNDRLGLAKYCNTVLGLMIANADLLYDITAHQDYRFFRSRREKRTQFQTRLEGLYAASNLVLYEVARV